MPTWRQPLTLLLASLWLSAGAQEAASRQPPPVTVLDPLEMPDAGDDSEAVGGELAESDAVLRRRGRGAVQAAGIAGLTWTTLEPVDVTIRLRPSEEGIVLRLLPAETWPELTNSLTVAGAVAEAPPLPYVDLPAANRGAAGTVLVLSDAAGHTLFRITGSATGLSAVGTVVELIGRVRRSPRR